MIKMHHQLVKIKNWGQTAHNGSFCIKLLFRSIKIILAGELSRLRQIKYELRGVMKGTDRDI